MAFSDTVATYCDHYMKDINLLREQIWGFLLQKAELG